MGKGNRVRAERADERKAKKLAAAKKAARERLYHNLSIVIAVVLVVAILFSLAYTAFFKDMIGSKRLHDATPSASTNYSINGGQMSYFFNYNLLNFVNRYSSSISMLGLDLSKPLTEQEYEEGTSWFDYFANASFESTKELLVLCEEANTRGITLDEDDQAEIGHSMEELQQAADGEKVSLEEYIENYYGKYVTEADVRSCLEIQTLANKVYTVLYDEPEYTDEQIAAECEDNPENYYFCDYKSLQIKAEYQDDADEDAIAEANEQAKAEANAILNAATSEEAFDSAVEDYYRAHNEIVADDAEDQEDADGANDAEDADDADDTATMTETELKEALEETLTEESAYTTDSDFGKWAFEQDEDGNYLRKAGDTSVITDEEEETYTVYYLLKPMYRHDYTTKNVRHLLITVDSYDSAHGLPDDEAKAKADDLLDSFLAGDATEDAFAALVKENTMDEGSAEEGGLYENVRKGTMVEEFEDWIYDEARKPGDTDVIDTDYGYHVMYFVGDGTAAWEAEAESSLRSADYDETFEALKAKYAVTEDDQMIKKIHPISLG